MAVAARVHGGPARLQAHARLLERRAHGDPGARRSGLGGAGDLRRAAPPAEQRPRPRACCSSRPATSTAPSAASRSTRCSGAMRRVPLSGTLFLLGFFAITGSPPFGPFVSEFTILSRRHRGGALRSSRRAVPAAARSSSSSGMGATVARDGAGRPSAAARPHDATATACSPACPALLSLALVLLLGLYIPRPVEALLQRRRRASWRRGRERSGGAVRLRDDRQRPRAPALPPMPELSPPELASAILDGVAAGLRVAAFFGTAEPGPEAVDSRSLVLADDRQARLARRPDAPARRRASRR